MQTGKIASLPRQIREQLNQRLDRSEKLKPLVYWLNSLPEVQTILTAEFEGEPVKRQNIQSWKTSSFRNWQLCRTALAFTEDSLPDDLDQSTLEKMSTKLLRCLQIRYAAVASSLPPPGDDPEAELRRLADLCTNLVMLRRGDLSAGRLTLEQERLALEKSRASQEREDEFWAWTKRPDIQEKLFPYRDPDKLRKEAERLINHKLLGIPISQRQPDENADPACFI